MTSADGGAGPGGQPESGWRWDVALSFAGAQRDYVRQVAAALRLRGVRCFFDADEQIDLWGKYLPEELPAIYGEQAAVVVMFVSAEYAARDWTRLERRAALSRAVRERREYVLPARFDDTPLPGLLSDVAPVDLRGRTPVEFAGMVAAKLAALGITGATPPADARARFAWRRYLEHVQDIAPAAGLLDRERELEELAEFCSEPGLYWWWRADPWAGKSALMAWFVLHPPADVTVVSFFVTARYASQGDSTAFAGALITQLEELAGPDLPEMPVPLAAEATYFRLLLRQAACRCRERGSRLVLVVDGLDEDRGPDAGLPSIASFLPKHADDDLKIIVAGRPAPKLPIDVPEDHPLREPRVAHVLGKSGHARAVRDAAELELRHVLSGTPAQLDLLGLLTAALGGLTLPDLADLTGLAPFEISQYLRGSTGRTFSARRPSAADPAEDDEVYLLAHETLQAEATRALGGRRLGQYRDRLHAWADGYRTQRWPASTPAYLLSGYFAMLRAAGDGERIIACAADSARHERLLDLSGGDTEALAEIAAAQQAILAQADPDLVTMARLARHRNRLAERNSHIPSDLPALLAALGRPGHAEALAGSARPGVHRALAMEALALELKNAGAHERAGRIAAVAVEDLAADSRFDQKQRADQLSYLAFAMADAGLAAAAATAAEHALAAAESTDVTDRAGALSSAAIALAAAGSQQRAQHAAEQAASVPRPAPRRDRPDRWPTAGWAGPRSVIAALAASGLSRRAETLTESITSNGERVGARMATAEALARTGSYDQAELTAQSITEPVFRVRALAALCARLGRRGQHPAAERLAGQVMAVPVWDAPRYIWQASVAGLLSEGGRHQEAAQIADRIVTGLLDDGTPAPDGERDVADLRARLDVLPTVARVLGAAGQTERAAQAAIHAESILRALGNSDLLSEVAAALTAAGLLHRAESLIEACYAGKTRVAADAGDYLAEGFRIERHSGALTGVARELLARGEPEEAARLARRAENVARSGVEDEGAVEVIATALADAGLHDRALELAGHITNPDSQQRVVSAVAEAAKEPVTYGRALDAARSIQDPEAQVTALTSVAKTLAASGLHDRAAQAAELAGTAARAIVGSRKDPRTSEPIPVTSSRELAAAGLHEQAAAMARAIGDPDRRDAAVSAVAAVLTATGLHAQASEMVQSIENSVRRDGALAEISGKLAQAGLYEQAVAVTGAIADPYQRDTAVSAVAGQLAAGGLADRASEMARSIENPARRDGVLAEISGKLAAAGCFAHAEQIAGSLTDPDRRAWALSDLAKAYSSAGMYQDASKAGEAAASAARRGSAVVLAGAATALQAARAPERAVQLADRAVDISRRSPVRLSQLADVAETLAGGGLDQAAARAADDAVTAAAAAEPDEWDIQGPLLRVVQKLAAAGFFDQAETIARSITTSKDQEHALRSITSCWLFAGRTDRAEAIARSISGRVSQRFALAEVAENWLAAGQYERAERAVRSIANPDERDQAMATLAMSLAAIGQHDQAEAIARAVGNQTWRPAALAGVAKALAAAGNSQRARQLIALAWTAGSWDGPVEALGSVAPEVLLTLADDVESEEAPLSRRSRGGLLSDPGVSHSWSAVRGCLVEGTVRPRRRS